VDVHYERRTNARLPVDIHVHVEAEGGGPEVVLLSHDWSSTSVFLRTHAPLPVGTRVSMFSVIGHPVERVSFVGTVLRAAPGDVHGLHSVQGMVIALDALPQKLRAFLEQTARRPYLDKVPLPATVVPPLLLISGDHPLRASVAQVFRIDGYDIAEAENGVDAAAMLDGGLKPRALVLLEDTASVLALLKPHFSLTSPPEACIVLGAPPRELEGALGFPLLLLPRGWPVEKLPELLKLLVPGEQVELCIA